LTFSKSVSIVITITKTEKERTLMRASKKIDLYGSLRNVLAGAVEQAESGKGSVRHANSGEAFEDQKICEIGRRLRENLAAGPLFQAVKKCYESGRLEPKAAIHELRGAINYIAASIILFEEEVERGNR
jgi:hypothetical protein